MPLSRMTLLAAGLAFVFSTVGIASHADAQAQKKPATSSLSTVGENEIIVVSPKGKVMKGKIDKGKGHFTKMQQMGARELKGAVIVRRGGKIYMMEDKPGTAPNKTMIQENFQDMFDTSQY